MTISEQEAAEDFISIKQIWLKQIDRCNELLSNYILKGGHGGYNDEGAIAAISSVNVLIRNLIDYGDAPIKTEFHKWLEKSNASFKGKSGLTIAGMQLEKIIDILNKYQMLHDSLPRGYTNVTMEGTDIVTEEVKEDVEPAGE